MKKKLVAGLAFLVLLGGCSDAESDEVSSQGSVTMTPEASGEASSSSVSSSDGGQPVDMPDRTPGVTPESPSVKASPAPESKPVLKEPVDKESAVKVHKFLSLGFEFDGVYLKVSKDDERGGFVDHSAPKGLHAVYLNLYAQNRTDKTVSAFNWDVQVISGGKKAERDTSSQRVARSVIGDSSASGRLDVDPYSTSIQVPPGGRPGPNREYYYNNADVTEYYFVSDLDDVRVIITSNVTGEKVQVGPDTRDVPDPPY